MFNATKSACKKARIVYDDLQFMIDSKVIPFVMEYTHLSHIISFS